MGETKSYFGKQFQRNKFFFDHETASDFYLSCWQNNRSTLPLLCVNTLLFLLALAILIYSLALPASSDPGSLSYWIIYLTDWGLLFITCATGMALLVSLIAYLKGHSIDATLGLPWYVKAYWIVYNVSVPVAMLITIIYYTIMKAAVAAQDNNITVNPALDLLVHAINSVVMLVLLLASRVPTRLLHFWQPFACMLLYLAFNIIYYYSGGTDSLGNHWIYPVMDWEKPAAASLMVVIMAFGVILLHVLVWVLSLLRDYCARKSGFYSESSSIST